jgi:5'-3' exonuclease
MINLNCIIDGNYLLHRHVHTLHKNNLLYGALENSLDIAISNYRKWFPFTNIYFVSDTKKKSWRHKLYKDYKAKRNRDSDIDWSFVFDTYISFKEKLNDKKIKLFELDHIEGDDWVTFIVQESNKKGQSNLIVSNDYDIKQILNFQLDPAIINFMTNEVFGKQKFFLPKNYQVFLTKIKGNLKESIFDIDDDSDFLNYIKSIQEKHEIVETDSVQSLLLKVISGDASDNIKSVLGPAQGTKKGIGIVGAKTILEMYKQEFGDPVLNDPDLFENIADLICEKKKINRSQISKISDNIRKNMELINLEVNNLPTEVIQRMKTLSI